jgi:hypothetical protein
MSKSNYPDDDKTEPNHLIPTEVWIEALESGLLNSESHTLIEVASKLIVKALESDGQALQKVSELVAVSSWAY